MARKRAPRKPGTKAARLEAAERFMGCEKNLSEVECLIRLDVGIATVVVIVLGLIPYPWDYVAGILSLALAMTALVGISPLYKLLGVSTRK